MTDKPREWPNNARAARDTSAESAARIIRALEPVVAGERPITETDRLRREAVALSEARRIAHLLVEQGAPLRGLDL